MKANNNQDTTIKIKKDRRVNTNINSNFNRTIRIFHINIQCLSNKVDQTSLFLDKFKYDIVCVSEHWLSDLKIKTINLPGYYLGSSYCRSSHIHGGVCLFVKDGLSSKPLNLNRFNTDIDAEFSGIELISNKVIIITLYRSGNGDFDVFLDRLENLLSNYASTNNKIIIAGDFNVNFNINSSKLTDLVCLVSSFGMDFVISDYTRINAQSSSCIDNITTNFGPAEYEAGVIDPCLSDHAGQFITIKVGISKVSAVYERRKITKHGLEKLRESLTEMDWSSFFYYGIYDVDHFSNFIVSTFKHLVEMNFPVNKTIVNNRKPPVCWFNDYLRKMRDNIASVKLIYDVNKDQNVLSMYKLMKKHYQLEINKTKISAYDSYIRNSDNKMRDSWRLINYERNNIKSNQQATCFSPDTFNDFFVTIASNLISTLPKVKVEALNLLHSVPAPACSFTLEPTTPEEVYNAVVSLKNSNCYDVYNLNSKLIKAVIDIIVYPLSLLINACFTSGTFPDVLKVTKVIPIFKKGDINNMSNYRPISIIPIFAKIFEVILKARIVKYFEDNDLLNSSQYGFRSNRSTTHAVLTLIDELVSNLEKGNNSIITLCDLTKAFDCVPHSVLLDKFRYYGITGTALRLIQTYLKNRKQCVSVNNSTSDLKTVTHGVPQGSVLGPILFIIYINDLCYYMSPSTCILFADDTTLMSSAENFDSLLRLSKETEEKVETWFRANKLLLSPEKTQRLTISTNRKLVVGNTAKLLGVVLDDSLSWSSHVDLLSRKLSSSIYLFRKLKHLLSSEMLRASYFALFHAHINYAVILWGNSSHAIRIFRQQKQIVRILANIGPKEHCRQWFIKLSILSLPSLFIFVSLLEIHKNVNAYTTNMEIHNHDTRSRNLLRTRRFRLATSKRNSLNLELYNKLPDRLKTLPYNIFKNKIKRCLLANCYYSVTEFLVTPPLL